MVRAFLAGAVLALAMATIVKGDDPAEWQAPSNGIVHLPVTANDFSTMIFTLLEQQTKFLAGQDGVENEGSPANLLATMASYLQQAQQAFFKEAAPLTGDELSSLEASTKAAGGQQFDNIVANHNITFPFPNQTFPAAITGYNKTSPAFLKNLPDPPAINWDSLFYNVTKAKGINHTDPISQDLINLLIQDPAGPELNAAFQALPTIPDPVSLGTANFSSGAYGAGLGAANGTRQFLTFSSTLFSYRPCFFQGNQGGISVSPNLIGITPRIAQVQPYGLEVDPKLIEVAPRIIVVKPIGLNVSPIDIAVSPTLISISPKVNFYHPAVPGVPGSGK